MKRVLVLAALALALLPACSTGTDRPEGVVERWLISLNQGRAGEPERYAPEAISNRILPGWKECDPGALDVIEVGRGDRIRGDDVAVVPYRVKYAPHLGTLCGARSGILTHPPLNAVALVRLQSSGWRIEAVGRGLCPSIGPTCPKVPSEGGRRIGSASAGAWFMGLVIGVGLLVVAWVLVAATPEPMPLPTEVGRDEGVGL